MSWVSIACVFIASLVLVGMLRQWADGLGLTVSPGAHRAHLSPTPVVGGIGMMLALVLYAVVAKDEALFGYAPALLLFVLGLWDDRYQLPSSVRLAVQCVTVFWLMQTTGIQLLSLGDLLGSGAIQLGSWVVVMTLFACIGVINALNMSDGMDGLAGTLAVLVCVSLLYVGAPFASILILVIASTAGFLVWNLRIGRPAASAFMGDAGSTTLGLLLAFFLINASQGSNAVIDPVTALWLMALPLMDAVGLLLVRPLRGRSPFAADHLHYHHALREFGLSVNQTLLVILCVQGGFIVLGLRLMQYEVPEATQFAAFLVLFLAYVGWLWRRSRNKALLNFE